MIETKRPRGNPNWVKGMRPVCTTGGKPVMTWQPPAQRAEYLSTHYTPNELIKMAVEIAAGKSTKLSTQDAIVCVQIANILQMRDGVERERLYDRLFGKVPDRTINLNLNLDASPDQLSERALALLQKIAPMDIEQIECEAVILEDDNSDLVDEPLVVEDDDDLVQE